MALRRIALGLLCLHLVVSDISPGLRHEVRKFPDDFLFGAASASYQVEGAWNEDGKSENIWDHDTHQIPSPIADQSTGDVATDSYHQYKRDVEMLRELGVDFYRFSLSWTRLLPTSFPDKINQAGVDYYNNLINELLKYNIKPMITLFHWDLPQKLQEMGGWTNPHIVNWYADYARVAFELFGDRVKYWITMNEPTAICYYGYGTDDLSPRLKIESVADFLCSKNLLLAHATAYHIYDKEFRPTQKGTIFITLDSQWYEPKSSEDSLAAKLMLQITTGLYAHPIFSITGDWPPLAKAKVALKSAEQGFYRSRMPDLTAAEIQFIRGTSDVFGLNHYSTYYVVKNETAGKSLPVPSQTDDIDASTVQSDEFKLNDQSYTEYVPNGFYKLLMQIKNDYGNPPVFITENGYGTHDTGLNDNERVTYYRGYLNALLDAMDDGSNIIGYTAWCLMDNFEWSQGYTVRFGIYHVDYEDPKRPRTPRKSAFVYKELVRTHTLDVHYEPDTSVMTIDEVHE